LRAWGATLSWSGLWDKNIRLRLYERAWYNAVCCTMILTLQIFALILRERYRVSLAIRGGISIMGGPLKY